MNPAAVEEAENLLFEEWRSRLAVDGESYFVPDGVIESGAYANSKPKIVVVLKETNDPGEGSSLCEILRTTPPHYTWNTVTRWVRAIRSLPDEIPWQEISDVDMTTRIDVLRTIAVMNVKKTAGGSVASNAELEKHSQRFRDLIERQVALYSPDIILLCGFSWKLSEPFGKRAEWHRTSRGTWFRRLENGVPVIHTRHPANRLEGELLHYPVIDAVRELLFNNE